MVQALQLLNNIIVTLGSSAQENYIINQNGLGEESQLEQNILPQVMTSELYQIIIEFLLEKGLQLTWMDLYQINFDEEQAFSDDIINQQEQDLNSLRGQSVELLRSIYSYIDEDQVINVIDQLLQQFTSGILTGNSTYKDILLKEGFYYLISGLFYELKNSIEFDVWFQSVLAVELQQNDSILLPLRLSITKLIYNYIENSYIISQPFSQALGESLYQIIENPQNSLFLRLLSLKNFVPLISSQKDIAVNLYNILQQALVIQNDCEEAESQKVILEFCETLIIKMKEKLVPQMDSIFNFVKSQWAQIQNNNSNSQLMRMTIIHKIASILKLSIIYQKEVHFKEQEFYFQIIKQVLQTDEGMESFLIEDCGLSLLYNFIKSYNNQINTMSQQQKQDQQQQIMIFQQQFLEVLLQLKPIFLRQISVFKISVLIFIEFSQIQSQEIGNLLSEIYTQGVKTYQNEIKDEIFNYLFDAIEVLQIMYPITNNNNQFISKSSIEIISLLFNQNQNQQQQQFGQQNDDFTLQKMRILRVLGRIYFQDFAVGQQAMQVIIQQSNNTDIFYQFLNNASGLLYQLKPDLCFYRYHSVLSLSYLQSLLVNNDQDQLVQMFLNISLNNNETQNMNQKMEHIFSKLIENFQIIQDYYNKSIAQESHWIKESLETLFQHQHIQNQIRAQKQELIDDEQEQQEQQQFNDRDIKPFYSNNQLINFLNQDELKKFNFYAQTQQFYEKFKNVMPQNMQIQIQEIINRVENQNQF